MQLPRGTFREIRKNVAIGSLLHELDREKFSGVANISSQSRTGTLVFKAGKCILVKVQNNCGDAGWDELQKAASDEMDAALSLLDDLQINMALEFNKPCRILKSGKQAPAQAPHRPAQSASLEPRGVGLKQKPSETVAPRKPPVKPAPIHHPTSAPHTADRQAPVHTPPPHPPPVPPAPAPIHGGGKKHEAEEPQKKDHDTGSFESDLDTFDTMDFDNVTDKIRTDCKTMIKQLHLEHLMER
jgi:hypothetical protein